MNLLGLIIAAAIFVCTSQKIDGNNNSTEFVPWSANVTETYEVPNVIVNSTTPKKEPQWEFCNDEHNQYLNVSFDPYPLK
jgi:hypothetical protein